MVIDAQPESARDAPAARSCPRPDRPVLRAPGPNQRGPHQRADQVCCARHAGPSVPSRGPAAWNLPPSAYRYPRPVHPAGRNRSHRQLNTADADPGQVRPQRRIISPERNAPGRDRQAWPSGCQLSCSSRTRPPRRPSWSRWCRPAAPKPGSATAGSGSWGWRATGRGSSASSWRRCPRPGHRSCR